MGETASQLAKRQFLESVRREPREWEDHDEDAELATPSKRSASGPTSIGKEMLTDTSDDENLGPKRRGRGNDSQRRQNDTLRLGPNALTTSSTSKTKNIGDRQLTGRKHSNSQAQRKTAKRGEDQKRLRRENRRIPGRQRLSDTEQQNVKTTMGTRKWLREEPGDITDCSGFSPVTREGKNVWPGTL
ncbi:MAG: hypothetical protein Q9227_007435 [Pyrenula ochraceoflavens]